MLAALHVSDNYNSVDHFVVVRLKHANGRWVEDGQTNSEGAEEQALEQRCSWGWSSESERQVCPVGAEGVKLQMEPAGS